MEAIDLRVQTILLPTQGVFADRDRLSKGIYFTCHYRTQPPNKDAETVRTARAGIQVDLTAFSRIGTIGLVRAVDDARPKTVQCAWVVVDVDNKEGRDTERIALCVERLRGCPFIEIRRSTSGLGLHLCVPLKDVYLATRIPSDESFESWKQVLVAMRVEYRNWKLRVEQYVRDLIRDTLPIDQVGGNNAIWMYTESAAHALAPGQPFELLKAASEQVDPAALPSAEQYVRGYKQDTASPRPRLAPGLPKQSHPKIIAFIQGLPSWKPREQADQILGHFHLAHLQAALFEANIPGYCAVRSGMSDLNSPNAFLIYHNEGSSIQDYAVCAMNGPQPMWDSVDGSPYPRLTLGTVSVAQLESFDIKCPDPTRHNGVTNIQDDIQYADLEKALNLHRLSEYDPDLSPFGTTQRSNARFPRIEWRPGTIFVRHDLGPATAEKIAMRSNGFWAASARGVYCPIRLMTAGTLVPKAQDHIVFDDSLKALLRERFCMVDPAHVNNGNRPDSIFCAPYYVRGSASEPWQPITTTVDLTAALVSAVNINVKSAGRARQVLRDQRALYVTHSLHAPLGRVDGDRWNVPLNMLAAMQDDHGDSKIEYRALEVLSANIRAGEKLMKPYLVWWLEERLRKQNAILPTLHFKNSLDAALFRSLAQACFVYPCVYSVTPGTRLNTLPARTLFLYAAKQTEEIPSPPDRILTIRDSAGPQTSYSVILSQVAHGVTDTSINDTILDDTNDKRPLIPRPYMGHFVRDALASPA